MSDRDWPSMVPESEQTPWQRWMMDGHRRVDVRYRQQARIAEWKIRQRREWQWANFSAMADWCAREPNGIGRDERRRTQAQLDLVQSVVAGEFSCAGRISVAYLPDNLMYDGPVRLRLWLGNLHPDHLHLCWAPRKLWIKWFKARGGIQPPPWISVPSIEKPTVPSTTLTGSQPPPVIETPPVTGAPGRPSSMNLVELEMERRAKTGEMIKNCLADEARALAEWLATEHSTMPPATAKTIQNKHGTKWRSLGGVSRKGIPKRNDDG